MKFLALSDTHGKHRLLKNLPPADVIIHAGDVSMNGAEHSIQDFLRWFSKLDYAHKIFIAGNHDRFFEDEPAGLIKKMIPENVIYLNDSGICIDGINIWGSPITPWFYDWAFNRERGKEINKHWKLIPENTDILVTHGPPFGILDTVGQGHVGCEALLKKVKAVKPRVHVFGHIHESFGSFENKDTRFINASVLDDEYELRNKPVEFTL
jgi:Icc-related predicted phosphoesterase